MNKRVRGARGRLLSEMGEFAAVAAEMAAAAVGLRGEDAAKAMRRAKRESEAKRWASVCESARLRQERIIQRDVQQLESRTRAVLTQASAQVTVQGEEQG